jgi:YggT family protein
MGSFVENLIKLALTAGTLLILGRVLISFVDPIGRTRLGSFLIATTEPILGPIRRALPQTGMLDLSPLIVLVILTALLRLL